MSKQSRRLDDRIRELCSQVVAAKDPEELNRVLPELKSAIHQAVGRVRERAIGMLAAKSTMPAERRKLSVDIPDSSKKRNGTSD